MWPYSWTHVGTPSHLGHMDRVAATMPSQAHAGAAQEAPNIGQWEGQDVPMVRSSSCTVKRGMPSSRRYLPTYLLKSSGKGVLKNQAGRPPWNSSWGVKPVEELRCEFMDSTAQGTRRTQSLERSCFIRILKFCSTTRFCLSQRGLDVWV